MFTQKHVSTKKGFTLIELMVVIVIIGILAAIAIPKLFGMSAKAKAQEVGPAAGTWTKLQLAYKMESGDWGDPEQISYKLPGQNGLTGNFQYTVTNKTKFEAESKFDSDPCKNGSTWGAELGSYGETPEMSIVAASGGDIPGCLSLTPNYYKIGCVAAGAAGITGSDPICSP